MSNPNQNDININNLELKWPISTETLKALLYEVSFARDKFPAQNSYNIEFRTLYMALGEEVGELANAYLENKSKKDVQKEALQVACVALRIYEESLKNYSERDF